MPAKPEWLLRLPEIRAELEHLDVPSGGSGRGRAYLRLEAPPGYRTTASVWRVPGWPHFRHGSCATSGSTAIIGVRGRLHRREAAAGAPVGRRGGIPRAPDLDAGPGPCARRGGAPEPGPAGARSPPAARHAFH